MALKPQAIRKGMQIWVDKKPIEKQDLLKLSEDWTESQENFFKKMLKQGGEFKIQGREFKTIPPNKILTSKGEKDGGIITIPGLDGRF